MPSRIFVPSIFTSIPRLYAAASLKPPSFADIGNAAHHGIPRLYAAASLKQRSWSPRPRPGSCIPRLYAAASLKQQRRPRLRDHGGLVFRGSMPRPH